MSALPLQALPAAPQRRFPRHAIRVPLDLIVLRSGVPETLPGRCTDISETGLGAIVAGEPAIGQQVALELRLPDVGLPVRARAVVRRESGLRCGLEFSSLSADQREMIRYWLRHTFGHSTDQAPNPPAQTPQPVLLAEVPPARVELPEPERKIRVGRQAAILLAACLLVFSGVTWWQWQRSWNELEAQVEAAQSRLQVPFNTMDKRLVTKVDPIYPESARATGTEGMVVLDATIAPDGSVTVLRLVSGPPSLAPSATQAVTKWKFEPYLSNGKPVEVETAIAVDFRLR